MNTTQKGTTLIETLIACAIFAVFSIAIYQLYAKVVTLSSHIRAKTIATEVVSEQFEFIRNLPYASVGTIAGIPSGVVVPSQNILRNRFTFLLQTTIRNIDHPVDGTLGGSPNDLSPADNKLIDITVTCTNCINPVVIQYSSYIAPKSLETENGNGAMVIKAIDANGLPIVGADVHIVNTSLAVPINITDVTDMTGVLTIVDAPPSAEKYEITVSKNGYSTDQSYSLNDVANPNPIKPHMTVGANLVSQSTFSIDQSSVVDIKTQNLLCQNIASIPITLTGEKRIGTNPNVIKSILTATTNSTGDASLPLVEWDTFQVKVGGTAYDMVGTNPIQPLIVPPGSTQQLRVSVVPAQVNSALVVGVVDTAGLPLADATVDINGPSGSFIKTTNLGSFSQSDWSGGGGQVVYQNIDQFFSADTTMDTTTNAGELKLLYSGAYASVASLISSTFDIGAMANFNQLTWAPITQPLETGSDPVRVQIATNNNQLTWNYIGPDGTALSYYTSPLSTVSALHNNNRYIRYKVFLSSTDSNFTPSISDIALTYTSGCLPPGQIHFGGLQNGTYTITVSKTGYTTQSKTTILGGNTYETISLSL